jgi:hypothetical protein
MIFPYIQVVVHQSVCRQPGLFDAPESPDYGVYNMAFKALQPLFFLSQFFGIIHA